MVKKKVRRRLNELKIEITVGVSHHEVNKCHKNWRYINSLTEQPRVHSSQVFVCIC